MTPRGSLPFGAPPGVVQPGGSSEVQGDTQKVAMGTMGVCADRCSRNYPGLPETRPPRLFEATFAKKNDPEISRKRIR